MTNLSGGVGVIAAATLLCAAASAAAADTAAPDAPVTTASGPAGSVAEQIDEYLRSSPAATLPRDAAPGVIPNQDEYERQIHGEFGLAIGTGGYRSAYVRSDIPIGKNGAVSIALSETKGRGYHGYGYGYGDYGGYGYGGYDGFGYGPYGDSRSVGIGVYLPGSSSMIAPDGREYAAGCGRLPTERQIGGINELVVEPGRGRCVDRWVLDER